VLISIEVIVGPARFRVPVSEFRNSGESETRLSPPATARHERAGESDPPASPCEALRAGGGQVKEAGSPPPAHRGLRPGGNSPGEVQRKGDGHK